MKYTDFEQLKKLYPCACQILEQEHKRQYPNAKFIIAAVGYDSPDREHLHMIVLFDIQLEDELLYTTCGAITSDYGVDGAYIDEYYVMSSNGAYNQIELFKD